MSESTFHIDNSDSKLPNQSFFSWLKKQTALFISQFIGLAGVVYLIAALIYYLKYLGAGSKVFEPEKIQEFVIYAHIPFLLLFIVTLLNILDSNASGSYRSKIVYERIFGKKLSGAQLRKGKIQLRKFKIYFLFFWILMLVLYFSFIFQINSHQTKKSSDKLQTSDQVNEINAIKTQKIKDLIEEETQIVSSLKEEKALQHLARNIDEIKYINKNLERIIATERLNNEVDSVSKLRKIDDTKFKWLEEDKSTVFGVFLSGNSEVSLKKVISNKWEDAFYLKRFEFFVFAGNNLSVLFIFWCFTVLAFPWHTKKHNIEAKRVRLIGTVVILIITVLFPSFLFLSKIDGVYYHENVNTYVIYTNALSGLINAIVLALFIARLDSKLIGLPSYLISVLYGYSAIQPLFVVFEQPGEISQMIKAFVLVVVFVFKIYFFLIITYAMQTGRMLDYLVCFPTLFGRVDSIFANQFQFEIHKEEKDYEFVIKNKNKVVYSSSHEYETKGECVAAIRETKIIMKEMREKKYYRYKEVFGTYTVEVFRDEEHKFSICSSIDLKSQDEARDLITESIANVPYCKVNLTKIKEH